MLRVQTAYISPDPHGSETSLYRDHTITVHTVHRSFIPHCKESSVGITHCGASRGTLRCGGGVRLRIGYAAFWFAARGKEGGTSFGFAGALVRGSAAFVLVGLYAAFRDLTHTLAPPPALCAG